MIRRPPRSPLFPYPTLSRSLHAREAGGAEVGDDVVVEARRGRAVEEAGARTAAGGLDLLEPPLRSGEHTAELQARPHLPFRLLLEKKKIHDRVVDLRYEAVR